MNFNHKLAEEIAIQECINIDEKSLVSSYVTICSYISQYPNKLSWRGNNKPNPCNEIGLKKLAKRYYESYRRLDVPAEPQTVPDEMVSVIINTVYGYSLEKCKDIKLEHQQSMIAENCVGNLLERYLESRLRKSNWCWCCGEFVKAIDFIAKDEKGDWIALQIKNRDNSENSSSSAIRDGTSIQKWFRSFSKDSKNGRSTFTNWENLPSLMQGYNLNEENFRLFVIDYLKKYSKSF